MASDSLGLELQVVIGIKRELGTNPSPQEEHRVTSPAPSSLRLVSLSLLFFVHS